MKHSIENAATRGNGRGIKMRSSGTSTSEKSALEGYQIDCAKSTREASLRRLADAIGDCDPQDSAWLMTEALQRLQPCARLPVAPFTTLKTEFEAWAAWISPAERRIALQALIDASSTSDQRAILAFLAKRFAA